MLETLVDKPSVWISGEGPDAGIALLSQCQLSRNLADYPFPSQCAGEEKHAVEERVLNVLSLLGVMKTGQYCSLEELDALEAHFLKERGLIRPDLLEQTGSRGVFVSDDQSLSIVINGDDHIRLQGIAAGLQVQEVWESVNALDDRLMNAVDFAFSEELGFLTASVHCVGTGLKASVVLHLPGLTMQNEIPRMAQLAQENRHQFTGVYGSSTDALGDLYRIRNISTLGHSEDEIVFHLRHLAKDIVDEEVRARDSLRSDVSRRLEDRIGRGVGIARGARLLEFEEALNVVSALRLGVYFGDVPELTYRDLNELMIGCQNAHLEMKAGRHCDDLTLNMERADMFRARLS